ncbi:MAG: polymer-forming cytoskeletal protein [Firmicutes bacterium]|nr:polymer-forming cytoskeletal protein [Bacillota bacterium]
MFNKKRETEINIEKIETIIGKSVVFEGRLITEGSLRVEGQLQGEIVAKGDLVVGETGQIKANIQARHILLSGEIIGNVRTSGRLEIGSTGKLIGDVDVATLVVEEGAVFQGTCKMKNGATAGKETSGGKQKANNYDQK